MESPKKPDSLEHKTLEREVIMTDIRRGLRSGKYTIHKRRLYSVLEVTKHHRNLRNLSCPCGSGVKFKKCKCH